MATQVELLSRAGCHLCEEARPIVASAVRKHGVKLREVDVDSDPELRERYGDEVPVVLIDGRQHAFHRVDPQRLDLALAHAEN
ncbi:glutaredoxin family protein [Sediminivirga luteola]|uniref:Thioredoxin family protein n=1 Tax=Sediminivirga luteola TaxID=1774748 RepID=A0A8J2XB13_9MICO|nr:glutaredoxin family protein [Sediminivirga luteola]MCI2264736.1 glutaredoxin family protein [Sediminivirga luteola]GGA02107.1 thioredoxin family protein [Sediminivirga luteola]